MKYKEGQSVKIIARDQAPTIPGIRDSSRLIGCIGVVDRADEQEGYWVTVQGVDQGYGWFDEEALDSVITFDDQLTHLLGSLIFIVKHTYSFEDDPAKKERQLKRNIEAEKKAKETIKGIVDKELEKVQLLCENEGSEFSFNLANAIEDRRHIISKSGINIDNENNEGTTENVGQTKNN